MCVISAPTSQSRMSRPGYVIPLVFMTKAVARTRAVTPVITSVVMCSGLRLLAGKAGNAACPQPCMQANPKLTCRGYPDEPCCEPAWKSLRTGDCPSTVSTFQRGFSSSKGTIAQEGRALQAATTSWSAGTVCTAPAAGLPQMALSASAVAGSISRGCPAKGPAGAPLQLEISSLEDTPSGTVGNGATSA
jgi:hypothetical protein